LATKPAPSAHALVAQRALAGLLLVAVDLGLELVAVSSRPSAPSRPLEVLLGLLGARDGSSS
jgi:hypothetical protein